MFAFNTLAELQDVSENSASGISTGNNFFQFFVVLLIFIAVLFLTAITTRWIANYQKGQNLNRNIEVIETFHVNGNKYIQLIRVGETYLAVSVGKDKITLLAEIPKDQIRFGEKNGAKPLHFKNMLQKAQSVKTGNDEGPREE